MHTFTGNWKYRVMMLLMAGVVASQMYFFPLPAGANDARSLLFRGMTLLIALFMGVTTLFSLIASFITYEVDANGISRRGWNGTKQMRWSDVSQFEARAGANSPLTLTDSRHNKLHIQPLLLASASRAELNQLLDTYLAPIRERQLREMGRIHSVYHPKRSLGWIGILMLPIVAGMLPLMLAPPLQEEKWAIVSSLFIFGGVELVFLHLAIVGFTHSLILTEEGITDANVFRTRRIPFHKVVSITSRTGNAIDRNYNQTIIEGDGQKIALTSYAKDYVLLTEYIRARVNVVIRQQGEIKSEEIQQKTDNRARILMPIAAATFIVFFYGLGIMSLREANAHREQYRLIDAQGQTTTGHIIGRALDSGNMQNTYLLRYAFAANGQTIEGESPVTWDDYWTARVGMSAHIIYVPGRKAASRLEHSIGQQQAESKVHSSYMLLVMGTIFPLMLAIAPFTRKRKKQTARQASAISA